MPCAGAAPAAPLRARRARRSDRCRAPAPTRGRRRSAGRRGRGTGRAGRKRATSRTTKLAPLAMRSQPVSSESLCSVAPKLLSASSPAMISTRSPMPKPLWPPNHCSCEIDAAFGSVVGKPCSSLAHPSGMDGVAALAGEEDLVPGRGGGGDVVDDVGMGAGGHRVGERVGREQARGAAERRHDHGAVLERHGEASLRRRPHGVVRERAEMRELADRHGGDAVGAGSLDREVDRRDSRDLPEAEPTVESHRRAARRRAS